MGKRYLKKVKGDTGLTIVKNKPVYGTIPVKYRDVDINLNGEWYNNIGADIYDSADPFGDGSLLRKYSLDGNLIDTVTGVEATAYDASAIAVETDIGVPTTPRYGNGVFGRKCLAPSTSKIGGCYINCGVIDRGGSEEITMSGWIYANESSNMNLLNRNGDGGLDQWRGMWGISPDTDDNNYNSRQPNLYYNNIEKILNPNNDINGGNVYKNYRYDSDFIGHWHHIVQVVTKHTLKLYVDGVLVDSGSFKESCLFNNGELWIRDKYYSSTSYLQQIEVYNRELTSEEVITLYNQQHKDIVPCDGVGNHPKNFVYITENNELVELEVSDTTGEVLGKSTTRGYGEIKPDDNLVKFEDGKLVDRYGDKTNILPYARCRLASQISGTRDTFKNNLIFILNDVISSEGITVDTTDRSFTVEEDGVYHIHFNDNIKYSTTDAYSPYISLFINRFYQPYNRAYVSRDNGAVWGQLVFDTIVPLRKGDKVQLRIEISSGVNETMILDCCDYSTYNIYKIGEINE